MGVDPDSFNTPKPVPGNQWYKLRLKDLKCKQTKAKTGYNYEAYMEVVENKAELNGSFVLYRMSNGPFQGPNMLELCHGLGFPPEKDGTFPGGNQAWEFDPKEPENPEKAKYKGPLLGKVADVELVITTYNSVDRNEIKQFRCKIDGCATRFPDIRHRTDLIGKK